MTLALTDDAIDAAVAHYREHGWARLGKLVDGERLTQLRARADAIMLGEVTYPGLFFQHDSESGRYEDLEYGKGWKGPSLAYRKVEKLELDPLFWAWIRNDEFRRVAARVYPGQDVSLYRAFLMNKHAGGGSNLPWHQDGGSFWGLDRDPTLQIWTGLDDAPEGGGCVEVAPRSHLAGLATPLGGVVPAEKLDAFGAEYKALPIPTEAGEVLLIHNHVWHRSGRTTPGHPRRALSVCYMDGRTACRRRKRAPRTFVQVFAAEGPTC
ncbi:MAG: phytanoyl-CoA dioxygenase family protein [Labilithrix sp.]|nr:phytanoyl-CoA dioxygenase family protein [Labilithrix sp.]MCW5810756.1 phytanoyl-CoA dioxygenase family protein [Labilithrix sp.]